MGAPSDELDRLPIAIRSGHLNQICTVTDIPASASIGRLFLTRGRGRLLQEVSKHAEAARTVHRSS